MRVKQNECKINIHANCKIFAVFRFTQVGEIYRPNVMLGKVVEEPTNIYYKNEEYELFLHIAIGNKDLFLINTLRQSFLNGQGGTKEVLFFDFLDYGNTIIITVQ